MIVFKNSCRHLIIARSGRLRHRQVLARPRFHGGRDAIFRDDGRGGHGGPGRCNGGGGPQQAAGGIIDIVGDGLVLIAVDLGALDYLDLFYLRLCEERIK